MIRKIFATVLLAITLIRAHGQCDVKLYDEMKDIEMPFRFLKRYSIKVSQIDGVPFSAQYSYVFTRGNTYALVLKESGQSPHLRLTLTNSDGEILNNELLYSESGSRELTIYKATKTGIYYLNVHAPQSFDGCAVLQLSYTDESAPVFDDIDRKFQRQFQSRKYSNLLKTFTIYPATKTETSYVLTSGTSYGLYVESQEGAKKPVPCRIIDADGNEIPLQKREHGAGILYTTIPRVTGIYYLEFQNSDKKSIAMAALNWIARTAQ